MNQAVKPPPLGRGLSALFGDVDTAYKAQSTQADIKAEKSIPSHIDLTWLQPGAFQPRRHFDEDALKGLTDSIRERGILEPLVVRPVTNAKDSYEIVAGERRWRAAQRAGLHEVPVVVRALTDQQALEFGLIENVQRQDLSPLEEAEGYKRLIDEFQHTQEGLAKIIGKSRPHIANMMRILTLPANVRQMIESGAITLGHARAIITSRDPSALALEIVKKGLNVRQAEALAKRNNDNPEIHKRKNPSQNADVTALEKDIERAIGVKVKIHIQGKGGSLTLYYHDLEQLDALTGKLKG